MFMNTPGTSIRAGALLSDRGIRDTVTLRSDRGVRFGHRPTGSDLCVRGIIGDVKGVCDTPLRGDLPGDVMRNAEELLSNEDYSLLTSTL